MGRVKVGFVMIRWLKIVRMKMGKVNMEQANMGSETSTKKFNAWVTDSLPQNLCSDNMSLAQEIVQLTHRVNNFYRRISQKGHVSQNSLIYVNTSLIFLLQNKIGQVIGMNSLMQWYLVQNWRTISICSKSLKFLSTWQIQLNQARANSKNMDENSQVKCMRKWEGKERSPQRRLKKSKDNLGHFLVFLGYFRNAPQNTPA